MPTPKFTGIEIIIEPAEDKRKEKKRQVPKVLQVPELPLKSSDLDDFMATVDQQKPNNRKTNDDQC